MVDGRALAASDVVLGRSARPAARDEPAPPTRSAWRCAGRGAARAAIRRRSERASRPWRRQMSQQRRAQRRLARGHEARTEQCARATHALDASMARARPPAARRPGVPRPPRARREARGAASSTARGPPASTPWAIGRRRRRRAPGARPRPSRPARPRARRRHGSARCARARAAPTRTSDGDRECQQRLELGVDVEPQHEVRGEGPLRQLAHARDSARELCAASSAGRARASVPMPRLATAATSAACAAADRRLHERPLDAEHVDADRIPLTASVVARPALGSRRAAPRPGHRPRARRRAARAAGRAPSRRPRCGDRGRPRASSRWRGRRRRLDARRLARAGARERGRRDAPALRGALRRRRRGLVELPRHRTGRRAHRDRAHLVRRAVAWHPRQPDGQAAAAPARVRRRSARRACRSRRTRGTSTRGARSRASAATFEGILRKHSRRADGPGLRDVAMFSVIDDDWPRVQALLEQRIA